MSQWLQQGGQQSQQGEGVVSPNVEMQSPDIALDMTVDLGDDEMEMNQENQPGTENVTPPPSPPQASSTPNNSPPTNTSQTSTLSAINMFLEQNPEVMSSGHHFFLLLFVLPAAEFLSTDKIM